MIYVNTNSTDVYYNFGCEYYFATEKRLSDDVFLLWSTTPTLMVGKYQNTLEEIDHEYARAHGIAIVRRMSGGGTIYTDPGGWQFTFITRKGSEKIEFAQFMNPVVDALCSLGLDVRTTGRNDIALYPAGSETGLKISGNTQFKKSGVTVHHGSLLFDTDIDALVRATTPKEYKITSKAIKSVRERVTNIRPHLPADMTGEEFRSYLVERLTGSRPENRYTISPEDDVRIRELAAEKFADERLIYGANPKFEIERELHLPGGTVEIGLTVKGGKITSAGLNGDFFASDAAEDLAQSLVGVSYTYDDVSAALEKICGAIYGIDAKDIADGIFEISQKNTL